MAGGATARIVSSDLGAGSSSGAVCVLGRRLRGARGRAGWGDAAHPRPLKPTGSLLSVLSNLLLCEAFYISIF